ncbi:ketopantoate reductase family protein [Streptomyces sp. LaPpAH-108]|uniref:ketopantoate reductase family protein n=1 Tax=Streptomyces sp. LaPpAH-108 TaxID=1155714 RepID=UPI00035D09B9|nr:2-dehydropantoate 2-reductase [Streptomyces sp. LaPpAH-108]
MTIKPTVAVLGPGGVGGLLAALLSRSGHRVICLARESTAESLRTDGIQVRSRQFGEFTASVEADTELREPVDACLIAVKQTGLESALSRVPAKALGDTLLVPFLNGVEHPAALRARYGSGQVAPAAIRVESTRVSADPVVIEQGSPFVEVDLASATAPRRRLDALAAALTASGVTTRVTDDATATLWTKLAFLAPFALLTTRYAAPLDVVLDRHRTELEALVAETAAVGRAHGAPTDAARLLARYGSFLPGTKSSMQRDAEAGRALELDAIGGALLRAAEARGVAVPVAARLVEELRAAGY